jgi:hypothetical protein
MLSISYKVESNLGAVIILTSIVDQERQQMLAKLVIVEQHV